MDLHRRALGRAGPDTFVLTQKYPKSHSADRLLCAQAFALQTGQNRGCNYFALLRTRFPNASAKTCYALPALKATIVLPDFARSLSADGNILHLLCHG
jgi:hypothetical protein